MMTIFPGMTPAQQWDLEWGQWVLVAHAAEQAAEERRRLNERLGRR